MRATANTLIAVGGCVILGPLVYTYLCYRLVAQTMAVRIPYRPESGQINFTGIVLPDYYVPLCLLIGALCIGVGISSAWRSREVAFVGELPEQEGGSKSLSLGLNR